MVREYFTLIGLMSSFETGRQALHEAGIFQRLAALDKQQGHDYLRRLILVNLDYTTDGNARNLLQLASAAFRRSMEAAGLLMALPPLAATLMRAADEPLNCD